MSHVNNDITFTASHLVHSQDRSRDHRSQKIVSNQIKSASCHGNCSDRDGGFCITAGPSRTTTADVRI